MSKLLDFYYYRDFEQDQVFGDIRLGQQVLNWGESTFIQNGINVVNPVDVNRLRTPGSELREALVPVPLVAGSISPNDRLSFEAYVQTKWKKTEIDPVGTYFSDNDYVGEGGSFAELDLREQNIDLPPNDLDDWLKVNRGPDINPKDSGQYGVAMRYLSESFHNTEFGIFFSRYHSRRPLVIANGGSGSDLMNGVAGAGEIAKVKERIGQEIGKNEPQAIVEFVNSLPDLNGLIGLSPTEKQQLSGQMIAVAQAAANAGVSPEQLKMKYIDPFLGGYGAQIAIDRYSKGTSYQVIYPEDISVVGLSFNTLLGNSGWALQGEVSHRNNAPLQREDGSILEEGLAPIIGAIDTRQGCPSLGDDNLVTNCINGIAAGLGDGTTIDGFVRRPVSQAQVTATKLFGPALGSDGGVFVVEAATTVVHDMPDSDVTPLEGPLGTEATALSAGLRAATRLDFYNAIGAVNLSPYLQVQLDLEGITPAPINNFVKGRQTYTVGVGADYLQNWSGNMSYTYYSGDLNTLRDRDFWSLNVKYSF